MRRKGASLSTRAWRQWGPHQLSGPLGLSQHLDGARAPEGPVAEQGLSCQRSGQPLGAGSWRGVSFMETPVLGEPLAGRFPHGKSLSRHICASVIDVFILFLSSRRRAVETYAELST